MGTKGLRPVLITYKHIMEQKIDISGTPDSKKNKNAIR